MGGQHSVAAVILAAGESRRYGSPKQLALLEGRTLLEHVLEAAHAAGLRPVVAVVPVWLTRPAAMADPDVAWVRNADPERGMSHSLRLGFAALPAEVEAAVILLGDQPTVTVQLLWDLLAARGERPIVATRSAGVLSPPVLIERSHFDVVHGPSGDIGLRGVLGTRPDAVLAIEVADPLPDVDSPRDLTALEREG